MTAPGKIPLRLVRPPRARGPPLCRRQRQLRRRHRAAGRQACRAGDLPASGGAHRLDRQDARRWRCRACTTCSTARSLPARPSAAGRPRYAERAAPAAGASTSRAMPANGSRPWWPTAARSPRTPPRRSRSNTSRCRSCSTARRPTAGQRRWCTRRTARTCCSTGPSSGARSTRISPRARTRSRIASNGAAARRCRSRPSACVASWDPWREILDVWASIQMPKYPDQIATALKLPVSAVRVHYDVDVGGSYGVKRGIKHTVLVGYLSQTARRAGAADRGPAGEHARRRHARARAHLRCRGGVRRRRASSAR